MTRHVKSYLKTTECVTDIIWLCHGKDDKYVLVANETNEIIMK
jgi:hypothetical protein